MLMTQTKTRLYKICSPILNGTNHLFCSKKERKKERKKEAFVASDSCIFCRLKKCQALPNDRFLDLSKMKTFADNKINIF